MKITFHIPGVLRDYTQGRRQVEVDTSAETVAQALEQLWRMCPGLRDRVLTEQGEIRQHLNIFIGEDHIRDHGGLLAPVRGDESITIVPAVSGGAA